MYGEVSVDACKQTCAGSTQGSIRNMRLAAVSVIPTAAVSYVTMKTRAPGLSESWNSLMRRWRFCGGVF